MMKLELSIDGGAELVGILPGQKREARMAFDTAHEAIEYAEENGLPLTESETLMGYKLGGYAVQLSESDLDPAKVASAIAMTTDPAWREAVERLGRVLIDAANSM